MKKTEEEIKQAARYISKPVFVNTNAAADFESGFQEGAKWMQEQDNSELREKDLALGNAYRMLKQIDNTIGLSSPQKKRLDILSNTIKKYFNVSDCLRIVQSDEPPKH